jgi:hypothetical protein
MADSEFIYRADVERVKDHLQAVIDRFELAPYADDRSAEDIAAQSILRGAYYVAEALLTDLLGLGEGYPAP